MSPKGSAQWAIIPRYWISIPYRYDTILSDAQRAIRYLRYNAESLNIHRDKIAIMGFSGGGRLAGMSGAKFDLGDPAAADPVDRVSCRPDAVVMGYASSSAAAFPEGSLMYNREVQRRRVQTSVDTLIHAGCPPYFIWQTAGEDDPRGICELGKQLGTYGVPFEMHLFPYAPHGVTLSDGGREDDPTFTCDHVARWVELCDEWLLMQGFRE